MRPSDAYIISKHASKQSQLTNFTISKEERYAVKKKPCDKLISRAIYHSGTTSFRFVEDPYFKAFCKEISDGKIPGYMPPDRKAVAGPILLSNNNLPCCRIQAQQDKNFSRANYLQ